MHRHHHHAPPDRDTVAQRQGPRRAGEHHAGNVIAVEHQGSLDRALRQHHFARADPPQTLARALGIAGREMIGQPLDRADEILVVEAERRGARQDTHIGHRRERHQRLGQPAPLRRIGERSAARLLALVDQDHPAAALRRRQRGLDPGRAAADHQRLAMRIGRGIMIGIARRRAFAQPGHTADRRLVKLLPRRARPHEGLVVETRREERPKSVIDRAEIEAERRIAVLACRNEPGVERHRGRAQIGRRPPAPARHGDERIGLLHPRREQPARAVIFERAPEQGDPARHQRRGQIVPRKPAIVALVEREGDRPAAIDPPPGGQTIAAHRRASPAL